MGEVATYQLGTGFENLKTYNDRVFAVSENSLYELNGGEKIRFPSNTQTIPKQVRYISDRLPSL